MVTREDSRLIELATQVIANTTGLFSSKVRLIMRTTAPHYWPFTRIFGRSPLDITHTGQVIRKCSHVVGSSCLLSIFIQSHHQFHGHHNIGTNSHCQWIQTLFSGYTDLVGLQQFRDMRYQQFGAYYFYCDCWHCFHFDRWSSWSRFPCDYKGFCNNETRTSSMIVQMLYLYAYVVNGDITHTNQD